MPESLFRQNILGFRHIFLGCDRVQHAEVNLFKNYPLRDILQEASSMSPHYTLGCRFPVIVLVSLMNHIFAA